MRCYFNMFLCIASFILLFPLFSKALDTPEFMPGFPMRDGKNIFVMGGRLHPLKKKGGEINQYEQAKTFRLYENGKLILEDPNKPWFVLPAPKKPALYKFSLISKDGEEYFSQEREATPKKPFESLTNRYRLVKALTTPLTASFKPGTFKHELVRWVTPPWAKFGADCTYCHVPYLKIGETQKDITRTTTVWNLKLLGTPALKPLITLLGDEKVDSDAKVRIVDILRTVTREDFGDDHAKWRAWWNEEYNISLTGNETLEQPARVDFAVYGYHYYMFIAWSEVPRAYEYEILRASKAKGPYKLIATVKEPWFNDNYDEDLKKTQKGKSIYSSWKLTLFYKIVSKDNSGNKSPSNEIHEALLDFDPSRPNMR